MKMMIVYSWKHPHIYTQKRGLVNHSIRFTPTSHSSYFCSGSASQPDNTKEHQGLGKVTLTCRSSSSFWHFCVGFTSQPATSGITDQSFLSITHLGASLRLYIRKYADFSNSVSSLFKCFSFHFNVSFSLFLCWQFHFFYFYYVSISLFLVSMCFQCFHLPLCSNFSLLIFPLFRVPIIYC